MAKHTPGPWKTYAGSIWSESPTIDKSKRCNTVATISPRWKMPDSEKEANARVIAAVPELLAALRAAVAGIDSVDELVGIVSAGDFGTRESDARASELEGALMLTSAEIHTLLARVDGEGN